MKKLMVAACVIALAAVAQAANVDWKWTSTFKSADGSAYSGDVYIINANSYSQQVLLTAFNGEGFDITDYNMGDARTTTDGKSPSGYSTIGASSTFTPVRTADDTKYVDFYYAALVTVSDKDYLFLGTTQNAVLDSVADTHLSKSLSASTSTFDSTTFSAQGWYAQSVPEPTSGILLILGMAGLALRRRRA